jgi:hypothetical protein
MIVRVGWITVPLAERITPGGSFLVAASAPPAKAATTRAATKLTTIARMAPRLFSTDNVAGLCRREQPFDGRSHFPGNAGALRAGAIRREVAISAVRMIGSKKLLQPDDA